MIETNDILKILNENYDIGFTGIEFHRDGGSLSYIVFSNEQKYFLRVVRPELLATAVQSVDIHLYLQNSNFAVPFIVLTKCGQPYIKAINEAKTNLLILYEYIEGTEPTDEDVENVGELIGRFHNIIKSYPHMLKSQEKYFFIDRYVDILRSKNHSRTEEYKLLGDRLWEKVKNLPRGYCHCDLYGGNVLKSTEGKLYVLDFDTSCSAFPVYDITLFCDETNYFEYSDEGFEKSKEWLQKFLKGYLKHCTLTKEETEAVYYFRAIYHFRYRRQ